MQFEQQDKNQEVSDDIEDKLDASNLDVISNPKPSLDLLIGEPDIGHPEEVKPGNPATSTWILLECVGECGSNSPHDHVPRPQLYAPLEEIVSEEYKKPINNNSCHSASIVLNYPVNDNGCVQGVTHCHAG